MNTKEYRVPPGSISSTVNVRPSDLEATTTKQSGGGFFFKQKTAYEISTRDWSSDVCSSDLRGWCGLPAATAARPSATSSPYKIGRASCREREEISVVAVSLKKNNTKNKQ